MRFKVLFYRTLFAVAGFLLPLGILAGAAPYVINAEPFKQHLIKELTELTGSRVELNGPVAIDSFGSLSLSAQDIEFYAFKGFPQIKALKAEQIVARIAWAELFAGRLDFDKIRISGAQVHTQAVGLQDGLAAAQTLLEMSRNAQFNIFIVEDGTILTEGESVERGLESLQISLDPSSQDVELRADVVEEQEKYSVRARVRAGSLIEPDAVVPLELALESPFASASFEGTAKIDADWRAVGKLAVALKDAPRLGKWLNQPSLDLLHWPVSISGNAEITPKSVAFDAAELTVAGQNGTGEFGLTLGEGRRELIGSAAFAALDLRAIAGTGETGADALAADPALLTDIFKNLRMDLRLSAESVRHDAVETGEVAITLLGENGRFSTEIANMAFLGGNVFGHASLDLSGDAPRIETRLSGASLDIRRMQSFAGIAPFVSGNLDGNIRLSGAGRDLDEMLRNAVASGKASISDGGQISLDLNAMASMAKGTEHRGWKGLEGAWSEFDALRFAFSIRDGAFSLKPITMTRANGNVRGEGVIDMRERKLDLDLSFAPNTPSGAADANPSGSDTILSIKGPLSEPVFRSVGNSNRAAAGTPSRYGIWDRTGKM